MIGIHKLSPVFICGHPKAGTSLLTSLLDGHSSLLVYPEESLFFRQFLPAIQGKSNKEKLDLADVLLIHIFQWNQTTPPEHQKGYPDRDYSDIDFNKVHEGLREWVQQSDGSVYRYLEGAILGFGKETGLLTNKTKCWVEKSPYNESYTEQIFNWWTEAKCIHIVRDPRDNYASYKRKHPNWSARAFSQNWVKSTRLGLHNQGFFGRDRYHLIYLEELLRDPEAETHRLAEFLDLEWENALLFPTRAGKAWRGNSMFDDGYQSISTEPMGRWQSQLSQFDLAMIQRIAGSTMGAVGYELAEVPLSDLTGVERIKLARERILSGLGNND